MRRSLLLLVLAAAASIPPLPLHAQVIQDEQGWKDHALAFAGRLGEWYATAAGWRDAMLDKGNAMLDQTREVVDIRKRYERMAVGELGKIGEGIPDLRDYGHVCNVEVNGESLCTAQRYLLRRYENVLDSTLYKYGDRFLGQVDSVEAEIHGLIGQQVASTSGAAGQWIQSFSGGGFGVGVDADVDLAEGGAALTLAAQDLIAVVEEVKNTELHASGGAARAAGEEGGQAGEPAKKEISSGRAQQLTTNMALAEAMVELELARQRLRSLNQSALDVSMQVKGARHSGSIHSVVW